MKLYLDPDSRVSKAAQLYEQIRAAISDGQLVEGDRLQPSRVVAEELGIARSTVTEAYSLLAAEGYVAGRRGGGTFVLADGYPHPGVPMAESALHVTAEAQAIHAYGVGLTQRVRYDLTVGRVDASLFPVVQWRRCSTRALADHAGEFGLYSDPAGSSELRRVLAHWVTQSRGVAATPDQVVVTHGTGHALDLLARSLLRPGDVAVVEEPGYPRFTSLLRGHGVEVVGVRVDRQGIVVDDLPATAKLVHVAPSHQFPLGVVLSRERRLALLRWAHWSGAAIIEDDYDSEFRYTNRPLEPLHRLDRHGNVIYLGTFSKILSPAVRTGFAIVPSNLVPTIAAVRQAVDVGPSPFITEPLTLFIKEGHLARHLRRARRGYALRHHAVWSALQRLPGEGLTPLPTQAGLHIALVAPNAPDDDVITERATHRGLLVSSLRRTYQFDDPRAGIVVGFGAIATTDVPRAIELLAECLNSGDQ